ncbi:unnamed protein product, partial [Mesocestoides corti]
VEHSGQPYPQLVAVSKTKPPECVIEAYNAGQRAFGENYIQELVEKSTNEELRVSCPEIRWHFIGRLQSNKIKMLTAVPNLAMVETISTMKMATLLNNAWQNVSVKPLDVLIQVNTSGEEQKGGVPVSDVVSLYKSISDHCSHLHLCGLMTIGKYEYDPGLGPNPDFLRLRDCRKEVCESLGLPEHSLHLSMGMSTDYEMAIALGSTMVRVGSYIFGARK